MRSSQQIRSNPEQRGAAYARHALHLHLAQAARVAQAELLLRESADWVDPKKVDEDIDAALENPVDLYGEVEPWDRTLEEEPEYVQGFEGPGVATRVPEFKLRRKDGGGR
jgi:hypothetical protein